MPINQFIGAWRLGSFKILSESRSIGHPLGEDAMGMIIYDAQGHMMVQAMRQGRPRFESDDQMKGTDQEIRAAFEGYLAYFGDYVVDDREQTITHQVKGSMFPNFVGQSLVRRYEFSGDQLTLTTPPFKVGGFIVTAVLVWERV